MTAKQKVQAARTSLVLDHPFFGVLALRLQIVEDLSCQTAYTNGSVLGYNPAFIDSLPKDQILFVIAHEVMHCAMGHMWRRGGREPFRANVAMDLAINPVLKEAGFKLVSGCLLDDQFEGKFFEWIYDRLPQARKAQGGAGSGGKGKAGQGQGSSQAGSRGSQGELPGQGACDVRDAPREGAGGEASSTESDWQQAVQQAAAAAKAAGRLPGSLARFVADAVAPRVDWKSVLHRFVQQAARADYSWRQPNARYLPSGMYLPSLRSEAVGPVAVAIDTSGSIDQVLLSQFAAELRSVMDDVRPERTHVIWCDAKVHRIDVFERDEPLELKPVGGGGTDFRPVFAAAVEMEERPVCVIYLTDMCGAFPTEDPGIPTLWASVTRGATAPFGEVVAVE